MTVYSNYSFLINEYLPLVRIMGWESIYNYNTIQLPVINYKIDSACKTDPGRDGQTESFYHLLCTQSDNVLYDIVLGEVCKSWGQGHKVYQASA